MKNPFRGKAKCTARTVFLVCLLILAAFTSSSALAELSGPATIAPPLLIKKGLGEYLLYQHLDILEDPDGTLTIDQIRAEPTASRFFANQSHNPTFGFTSSAYWVRFLIGGDLDSADHWLLEIAYPLFDHISIFLPQADGNYLEGKAGDLRPFAAREVKNRYFIFNLPDQLTEKTPIYIRFETESSMNILMTVWSHEAFTERDHNAQFGLGLFYGFIMVMILYSFLMLAILRDINYFYYLFFIVNFGLY